MKSPIWAFRLCAIVAGLAIGGCIPAWRNRLTLPETYTVVRDQLVIHSDFPLPSRHRLFEELTARRADLHHRLGLPVSDEPIHVYLFESPGRFETFVGMHHPGFPARRAFFLETDTKLRIYTQWGDYVAEDLRHEVTHGYLHSVVPNMPLWVDEGLAEYFEVPRGHHGLNRTHLEQLLERTRQDQWRPDLARLEALDPAFDMTQEDYAEAWAWVHFLLETRPEYRQMLRDYLCEFRRDGTARPLSERLRGRLAGPDRALVQHVQHLGSVNPR